MRKVSEYALWIGNRGDLEDVRLVLNLGIEAVLELADSEPFATLPRDIVRCRFPISDGGDNFPWLLRLAVETVATLLKHKIPVLVCCSAGMSRSICVAAGGIAIANGRTLAESLTVIVEDGPADVSPALFWQLQQILVG
jgi:protein-tyrosine phosphatase